jgi:predicted alpha/beta superfamily hydrolase
MSKGNVRTFVQKGAFVVAVLFALIPAQGWAQEPSPPQPVTIANTERRLLRSRVNGVEYQIDVALPRGYSSSHKRYPTLYALDGNVYFPLVVDSYRLAAYLIPDELIVVGIGYPINEYGRWSKDYGASRGRDYTTRAAKPVGGVSAGTGGAALFLRFIREELVPFIDSKYRSIPGDRGLLGHSFGGLFGAYVLTHEPELFQKYVLGSPSVMWDNEAGLRWEAEYAAAHKELRARVYAYVSEYEDESIMKGPTRRFCKALRNRHYVGLDFVDFVIVPDEIHVSAILGSTEHALRKLYAPRPVSLPAETLQRYVGNWKASEEPLWSIRLDLDRLFVEIPSYSKGPLEGREPERRELLAQSETSFFSALGDIRVVFTLDADKRFATEMKVTIPRHGYSSVLRKVPEVPAARAAPK